ncbi:MAG: hypothetical protein MUE96_04470 [Bacteroidia bacterium]|jgi:hypothetical protein|nr:hypothetical protein [Bacteroidia bacterium]
MKKNSIHTLVLALLTLTYIHTDAQNTNEAKTLFGSGNPINTKNIGFFIAPSYGFTQMDGTMASLLAIRGGINIKDQFSIGSFLNTSLNEINPQSEILTNVYMDYWSVGGFIEYTLLAKKVFHVTFPLYIGYGEVEMDNQIGEAELGEANFAQIEPSALLEVNLHKHVRFNLGAGYRFVGKMNYRNLNESDISGVTGYVGLKFGLFK